MEELRRGKGSYCLGEDKPTNIDRPVTGESVGHGSSEQLIRPGDTVFIAPHERHWHGAAPGRTMTHLAMQEVDDQGRDVTWQEHVTDHDYLSV